MNAQMTIAELLATTGKLDELPLGTVRSLLALRPQARELVDRLDALEQNVGGLLATPSTMVTVAVQDVPTPAPYKAVITVVEDDVDESRWTLRTDSIEVGIIAWFDDDTLNTDPQVSKPEYFDGRVHNGAKGGRPFVCVEADDETSAWVSLSRKYNERYLKLATDWIWPRGALNGTSHVTGNIFRGPHHSFCVAAVQVEHDNMNTRRPKLNAKGRAAVLEFVGAEIDA
jgi:hypothetical protein